MHTHSDEAKIRETAYLFWLDEGRPAGRDKEHWLKAVEALAPRHTKTKTTRKAAAKPAKIAAAPKAKPRKPAAP